MNRHDQDAEEFNESVAAIAGIGLAVIFGTVIWMLVLMWWFS